MTYELLNAGAAILHVECGAVSHNAEDVRQHFCGACHEFLTRAREPRVWCAHITDDELREFYARHPSFGCARCWIARYPALEELSGQNAPENMVEPQHQTSVRERWLRKAKVRRPSDAEPWELQETLFDVSARNAK